METRIKTRTALLETAKFRLSFQGIKESMVKMLERIDPLELVATVGVAFVIYDLIKNTEEFLVAAQNSPSIGYLGLATPILQALIDAIFSNPATLTNDQKATIELIKNTPDYGLFIKSFALAFILVRNSGQVLNGISSITSFVAGALGLAVAV